jgi:hypothetical protein
MVLIFSFDQAIRNLGLCVLRIQKSGFDILKLDTWDMVESPYNYKNQPAHVTAKNLKLKIRELDEWQQDKYPDEKIIIMTEYIFMPGAPAQVIGNMIVYHYSGEDEDWVKIYPRVPPAQKNQICLGGESLKYYNYAEKYKKAYDANKNHSKANFLHFIHIHPEKLPKDINDINFKMSKADDVADAFLQALAMIFFGKINVAFSKDSDILISEDESRNEYGTDADHGKGKKIVGGPKKFGKKKKKK